MTYGGRIDARRTVPTGGAAVSATNNNGGPTTCTVPAGNYFMTAASGISGLCAELQSQLNTSRPDGWTVTLSITTGKVTIDCSVEPWALTWTSTNLRDMLGFTGNIASTSAAQTGSYQARGLWIPDCPPNSDIPYHAAAPRVTDRRSTVGPTGVVISHTGNVMFRHPGWRYSHVTRSKVFKGNESTTNESWERFLEDVAWGEGHTWFDGSALCQVYDLSDAVVGLFADGNNGVNGWYLRGPGINSFIPMPVSEGYSGWWRIDGFDLVTDG